MKISLRFKVLAITLIILAVSQVIGTLLVILSFNRDYTQTMQSRFEVLGRNLSQIIEDSFLSLGIGLRQSVGVDELLADVVESNPEISYIAITDAEGGMLYQIDPGGMNLTQVFPSRAEDDPSSPQRTESRQVATQLIEGHYDTLVPLFDDDDQHVGDIHLGFPTAIVTEKVGGMVRGSLIVMSVSLLTASGLLVIFMSLGVTRPVSRLVGAMEGIIEGRDLTKRVNVASADEVGDLANRFNEFVNSIEGVVKRLASAPNAISDSAEELRRALADNSNNVDLVSMTIEELKDDVNRDMDRIVKLVGRVNEISRWAQTIAGSVRAIGGRMAKTLTVIGQVETTPGESSDGGSDTPKTWDMTGLFNSSEELGGEVKNISRKIVELTAQSLPGISQGSGPMAEEIGKTLEHGRELSSKIDGLNNHIHTAVHEFAMDRSVGILKIREMKEVRRDLSRTSRIAEDVRRKLADLLSDLEKRASDLAQDSERMVEDLSEVIEAVFDDYKGVRDISLTIAKERKALSEVPPALESFRDRFEKLRDETKEFKIG